VGHSCLLRWILLGRNWCRYCGALWFREQHSETLRGTIWRKVADIEVVGIDLWAGIPEDEHGLQGQNENGRVGEGECENMMRREGRRMCVGFWTVEERDVHSTEMMMKIL
jgi:hypothetical protein